MPNTINQIPKIDYYEGKTDDGLKLRYAIALPTAQDDKSKSPIILFLSGRTEFIEKYNEVIYCLQQEGFTCLFFDWRGQGRSQRLLENNLGHINKFSDYQKDLKFILSIAEEKIGHFPDFLIAHSMGGNIALHYPDLCTKFKKIILISPMIRLCNHSWIRARASMLFPFYLHKWFNKQGVGSKEVYAQSAYNFDYNLLTNSKARFLRTLTWFEKFPELEVERPSFGWIRQAIKAMQSLKNKSIPPSLKGVKPNQLKIILAKEDGVVNPKATETWINSLKLPIELVWVDGKHEPLQEEEAIFKSSLSMIIDFFRL